MKLLKTWEIERYLAENPDRLLTVQLPKGDDIKTTLAIADIIQFIESKLHEIGVDPVRTKLHWGKFYVTDDTAQSGSRKG